MFRFKLLNPCKDSNPFDSKKVAGQYSFKFFEHYHDVSEFWQPFENDDVFWGEDFLSMLEKHGPEGIKPYYCVILKENEAVGIAYYQLKKIHLKEALKTAESDINQGETLKTAVVARINFYNLVCGNMLLTGKYSYQFKEKVEAKMQFEIITLATNTLINHIEKTKHVNVGTVLIKDFFNEDSYPEGLLENYTTFCVQPNMILDLSNWSSFEKYLSEMKAKYRTRVNRAFKKCQAVDTRELSLDDLKDNMETMHQLYLNVALNANFNLFVHKKDYFFRLKESLKGKLLVIGFFLEGKLIGFYTAIKNQNHLDAHFLGYNTDLNAELQLYLNMLLNMVQLGFDQKVHKIIMSRTAMEIKSSVGAEPYDMTCYLKHTKPIYNHFVPSILKYLNPKHEWTPRSPFKD